MAYDSLKNIIRQYIKTNGEQEITGQIMQNVLIEMVNNYPSTEGFIRANLSNLANGDILIYDSVGAWYNTPLSSFFNGYATQLWVNQQGYVTSSALAGYIHPTITDLANGDILIWDSVGAWVNAPMDATISGFGYVKSTGSVAYATSAGSANILGHSVYENLAHALANGDMLVYDSGTGWTNVETSSILSGYATQSWVTSQGYITSSALNGYATEAWVNQQGYLTSSALNGYIHPTITNLANGDILVYDSVGAWYNIPLSSFFNGYATQSWVNTQLAGYLPLTGGTMTGTLTADEGIKITGTASGMNGDLIITNQTRNTQMAFGHTMSEYLMGFMQFNEVTKGVASSENSIRFHIYDHDNLLNILGSGNVGVGTTSPEYKLEANGKIVSSILYNGSKVNTVQLIPDSDCGLYMTTSIGQWLHIAGNGGSMFIYNGAWDSEGGGNHTYGITITTLNAIGIGTSQPAYKLDVNGTLNATTIYQNGTALSSIFISPNLSNLANGDILVYDTVGAWYNTSLSSFGFATQTWVGQQGYLTSSALAGYIHPTLTNLANGDILIYDSVGAWVNTSLDTTVAGFGYITSSALANYLPLTGGSLTGGLTAQNGIIITGSPTSQNGDLVIKNYANNSQIALGYQMTEYLMGFMQFSEATKGVASSNNSIRFHIYGHDNLLNILGSGNVGVGTTSPEYKLEANGKIVSSILYNGSKVNTVQLIPDSDCGLYMTTSIGQWLHIAGNGGLMFIYNGAWDSAGGGNHTYGITITTLNAIGIGTSSPSYKLDVNGSANATTLYENGSRVITTANIGSQSVNYATSAGSANILGYSVTLNSAHSLSNGDILVYDSVGMWTNVSSGLSDIRQKNVINYDAEPLFESVVNAPAIKFIYKDNTYSFRRGIHVGSIAQYWQTTLPETVSIDNEGMLSMQYDVIALLSTISVAKKVSEHERRIVILERENEELRKELAALKSA